MTAGRPRLVVVGGGVIGTMHALAGLRRGYDVVQLERDLAPRGASVRNFGLVWVSGRASGPELDLALRARELWGEIGARCPATGFRAAGSLTCARRPDELAAIELASEVDGAAERGFRLLLPKEVAAVAPALEEAAKDGGLLGALYCSHDAAVEPRLVPGAIRAMLEASGQYRFLPAHPVMACRPHGVLDAQGSWHEGDLVVCCPGASAGGFLADKLTAAPLRRVRLQMLETEPFPAQLGVALADADSLRYYPAYDGAPRRRLAPQVATGAAWAAQLLLVQRNGGHLTIGDTHSYDEPFPFDLDETPYRHLLEVASSLLGPLPGVERRWAGVYSQVTDDSLYYRAEVEPGVVVVTGPGGRGMTMSPAIAEETFA
jgi:FAD dependent oxidoreductase TIGR03364